MKADTNKNVGLETRILENLSTAVLLFGADLRVKYINPAGEMLFAVSARHLIGNHAEGLLPCPGNNLKSKLSKALNRGHSFTEREILLTLPDGRSATVNCFVEPLPFSDAPRELLVELQQVDRQLRISREEHLLSQQKATQALVRGLAHEIKNPLGGLRGAAQLLEQELPDKTLREYTRVIIDEADRLKALMNQMLGPTSVERREQVNIHQVLERVRNLVLAETGRKFVIRRDYDPSIPKLIGQPDQLIQAFLNIIRNGVHAAGEDGRIILKTRIMRQFTIGNYRYRLVTQVEIEDNGPGISQDLQDRIFLPMVTGAEGGTGLGLTIAQTLINQHRGLIECRSKPGRTVFSVFLPLENSHE